MKAPVWTCVALILASIDLPAAAGAPETVTEADAIRLFREENRRSRLVALRTEAARAESSIGSEISNPAVAYQVEDAAGVRDEFLIFQQEMPITGRRSLLRGRAEAAFSAARLQGERDLQDAIAALRIAFYDILHRGGVVEILVRGEATLGGTVEMLRQRERQGEGSGYDVLRAEQEMAELQARLGRARAESVASRARFGSFFDASMKMASAALAGDLEPADMPWSVEEAVAIALEERADLLALREEVRRHDIDLRAARRERIPEPVLSAGWKRVEALGDADTGFVASVMIPLPIFDRGRYEAARARAASGEASARADILERAIRAEVESAFARQEAARRTAGRFGDPVVRRAGELRRIARLAYDEGEMGILELLDAFRTSLGMEMQSLEVRHEARRERIELDRVLGREVQP